MRKAILRLEESRPFLRFRGQRFAAMIGAHGITPHKTEGDLCTPTGLLPLRKILYRADRKARPVCHTALPVEPIGPQDGWCDDPQNPHYNTAVRLPYPASSEALWREDHAYDICVVLGWNDAPPYPGAGSAIFLHLPPQRGVTEGCIALPEKDLRFLLQAGLREILVEGAVQVFDSL